MNTKIIGIFGCGQSDLCIYLANILENMKYQVLVIDNSKEQKIKLCIPKPEEKLSTITYQNVDYAFLRLHNEWIYDTYDFILVDMGDEPKEDALVLSDFLIGVLDCELYSVKKYLDICTQSNIPIHIIFRNYCKNYMPQWKFKELIGKENSFVADILFLPVVESDECNRILMQYEGYHGFYKVSKELEMTLLILCCFFSGNDYGEVRNALRRAKRGECY